MNFDPEFLKNLIANPAMLQPQKPDMVKDIEGSLSGAVGLPDPNELKAGLMGSVPQPGQTNPFQKLMQLLGR